MSVTGPCPDTRTHFWWKLVNISSGLWDRTTCCGPIYQTSRGHMTPSIHQYQSNERVPPGRPAGETTVRLCDVSGSFLRWLGKPQETGSCCFCPQAFEKLVEQQESQSRLGAGRRPRQRGRLPAGDKTRWEWIMTTNLEFPHVHDIL